MQRRHATGLSAGGDVRQPGSRLIDRLLRRDVPVETPASVSRPGVLVVRADHSWWTAPVGSDDSERVTIDEVLGALSGPVPELAPEQVTAPLNASQIVDVVAAFAGEVTERGLVLEDRHGARALLEPADLRIIDSLPHARHVSDVCDLAAESDPPLDHSEVADRLARMARLGVVLTLDDFAPPARHDVAEGADQEQPVREIVRASGVAKPDGPAGRIPVYAIWHPEVGPLLALGMLTAAARHHNDGALNEQYEIRRPEIAQSFLEDLAQREGPAVLLCSNYVWSIRQNLEAARRARLIKPDLVILHGGPSSPKYEADAARFLDDHDDIADVLTRGEGEELICELLEKIAPALPSLDVGVLRTINGLTFRDPTNRAVVRTPDRPRLTDLSALPSPYLTGEFDHIDGSSWTTCLSIETSRGCPYSCSFCDWGSSTMSRIRMFDLDRVTAEAHWAAVRGVEAINLPDANFGIMSRDVETARRIAEVKKETGFPRAMVFYPAKNTTKHFLQIMDILADASISCAASLSLQTTDEATLAALDRENIPTDLYVALAAAYRRRGHPLQGDLLLGIPGQSYDSFRRDLQFMLDQEILVRTWPVQLLPNAPMNAPEYRERYQIEISPEGLIASTNTFTPEDRARMVRLRKIDIICERMGLLRHLLRWVQWDHGVEATEVMARLQTITASDPHRIPHVSWVLDHFDVHTLAPAGWGDFYAEVASVLAEEFGIGPSSTRESVIALNRFLLPDLGRSFPETIELPHDYLSYYLDATHDLFTTGRPGAPSRPLSDYPPASFTVTGDPLSLCDNSIRLDGDPRSEVLQGEFLIASSAAYELASPLTRIMPGTVAADMTPPPREIDFDEQAAADAERDRVLPGGHTAETSSVSMTVGTRR